MNDQKKQEENPTDIIFFLGAGASVPANVPDTRKFIYGDDGFLNFIGTLPERNQIKCLNIIISKLEERFGDGKADLERVLETLININTFNDNLLLDFLKEKEIIFNNEELENIISLEAKLRQFIREKTIVSEDSIVYLEPLRSFTHLKIYSVNYDTCIEQFCNRYSLSYTDGFELYWHPEFFKGEFTVKHYKLHGSVMWWLTNKNTYVKIPIKSPMENIELITGESAKNVIIYPVPGKINYGKPLHDLITSLCEDLNKANICFVIGYTFRDDDIKQIFFEVAEQNSNLLIVLIAPSAHNIYNKQLKVRKADDGPSSLEGRVICFNYPMENVLRTGYLLKTIKTIEEIKSTYDKGEKLKEKEGGGWKNQLSECVMRCAEIGYIDKAEKILETYLNVNLENLETVGKFKDSGERFKFFYMMGMGFLLNGQYPEAIIYFEKLHSLLSQFFEFGLKIYDLVIELNKLQNKRKNEEEEIMLRYRILNEEKIQLDIDIETKNNELKEFQKNVMFRKSLFWCVYDSDWGKDYFHKWIDFLQNQKKLLGTSKENLVSVYLDPILDNSKQIWNIIKEPPNGGRYNHEKKIGIDIFEIEIERKEESEKYYRSMLYSILELIKFLKQ